MMQRACTNVPQLVVFRDAVTAKPGLEFPREMPQ